MRLIPIAESVAERLRSRHFWLRLVGAAALSLLLFYVIFLFVDLEEAIGIITKVSAPAIILGFVFYLGSTLFRAARFNVIHQRVSTHVFFSIASVHTLLTNLLPARAGELAFPVLLKRVDKSPIMSSLSILVVARLFDLIAIFLVFFISLGLTFTSLDPSLHTPILAVSLFFFGILTILFSFVLFGKRALYVARRCLFFDGLKNNRVSAFIFEKLEQLLGGMAVLRRPKVLAHTMLFSVLIWVCNYVTVYVLITSMGLNLSAWVVVLALTFSTLFSSLPIHGLGSFGTLEGAWTIIFLSFGVSKELSFATGLGFHLFNLGYLAIFALAGVVHLALLNGRTGNTGQQACENISAGRSRRQDSG